MDECCDEVIEHHMQKLVLFSHDDSESPNAMAPGPRSEVLRPSKLRNQCLLISQAHKRAMDFGQHLALFGGV